MPLSSRVILTAHNVAFSYTPDRTVFHGLTLNFAPGRLTAVLGPNGCGKSTLLRLCLGNLAPTAGTVTLDATDVQAWPRQRFARHVALVPQRDEMAFAFTVAQAVGFGPLAWKLPAAQHQQIVARALQELGLAPLASQLVTELSQGQRQRMLLARAVAQLSPLAHGTGVLLADEPAASLDPKYAIQTMECLKAQAAHGRVVVAVMHDINAALRFADHAVLLDEQGHIAASGPPTQALTSERLAAIYGVPSGTFQPISGH